jgi:hypothetical protein
MQGSSWPPPMREPWLTLFVFLAGALAGWGVTACAGSTDPAAGAGHVWHVTERNGAALPAIDSPSPFMLVRGGLSLDPKGGYAFVTLDSFPNAHPSISISTRETGTWRTLGAIVTLSAFPGGVATLERFADGSAVYRQEGVRYRLEPGAP